MASPQLGEKFCRVVGVIVVPVPVFEFRVVNIFNARVFLQFLLLNHFLAFHKGADRLILVHLVRLRRLLGFLRLFGCIGAKVDTLDQQLDLLLLLSYLLFI